MQPTPAASLWGRAEEAGMKLNITFRHFETSEFLKTHALEQVERVSKYLEQPEPGEIHMVLSMERHLHHADVTLYGQGLVMHAHVKCDSMYAAIEMAVDKIVRQLQRRKDKF